MIWEKRPKQKKWTYVLRFFKFCFVLLFCFFLFGVFILLFAGCSCPIKDSIYNLPQSIGVWLWHSAQCIDASLLFACFTCVRCHIARESSTSLCFDAKRFTCGVVAHIACSIGRFGWCAVRSEKKKKRKKARAAVGVHPNTSFDQRWFVACLFRVHLYIVFS